MRTFIGHLGRPLTCSLVMLALPMATGCVSADEYRAAKRWAEQLAAQLQAEQRRAQDLETRVRELSDKVRDLETVAQAAREEAARREREYKDIRDELLRFKIPLEQQRVHSNRSRVRERAPERPPDAATVPPPLAPRTTPALADEDSKRRLQDALQELQRFLESN
ncbi:MAG: hypothetical protein AB1555_18420 [Nitrospirota bacterium]